MWAAMWEGCRIGNRADTIHMANQAVSPGNPGPFAAGYRRTAEQTLQRGGSFLDR